MIWAGEQGRKKVKKERKKIDTGGDNFTYTGTRPAERTITKFGVRGRVVDVIICVKILSKSVKGFPSCGGGGENGGLPLTLTVALTTGQHYCAACDVTALERNRRFSIYFRM